MDCKQRFYESGLGDRLIDPLFFPESIKDFLDSEQQLLESLKRSIDLLIEVGCMQGRYLEWAIEHKKHYLGLDVVRRYINNGIQRVNNLGSSICNYKFVLGGAEKIASLVKPKDWEVKPKRCLLLFPFNSFGNIPDPKPTVRSLAKSNLPFLISSYQTSKKATACRERYYRNCGYRKLRMVKNKNSVCFVSPDGLHSIAYHPRYLQDLFMTNGIRAKAIPFSRMGMLYASVEIATIIIKQFK